MGFQAQAGHVIFRSQAVAGTYQADIQTAGVAMKITGGQLSPTRTLMITDPEIGGSRDVNDALLGPTAFTGTYDFYARMDSLTTLLQAALGPCTPSVVSGVTTCTFTPSDASSLPLLSVEEEIASNLDTFSYTDAVVNTLHLEAAANGFLTATVGLIAKMQLAGVTPDSTPTFDNSSPIVGTNITVTYNSIALPAKSFKFDLTNQFDDTDFRLGSFYLGDLTPKRREITVGFTIRPADVTLWRQANYGTTGATAAGGVTTKSNLVISCTTYDVITAGHPRNITITIPQFALKPFPYAIKGDDVIDLSIEGEALRPVQATPIMTVVTVSANATIA